MSEQTDLELQRLIAEADNARDRALLLVLFKMQQSLSATAEVAAETAAALLAQTKVIDEHRSMIDRGRGGWWVLSGVVVIVFGLMGWVVNGYVDEQRRQAKEIVDLRIQVITNQRP